MFGFRSSSTPPPPPPDAASDPLSPEVVAAVRRIQLRASRVVNDVLAGQYHSTFRGVGMEFDEVRVYAPGDDVRSIDWNVTARTGVPHIKRFVEERELTVQLLVDVSASMTFGSVRRPRHRIAAELCALLALCAITNNDKVGVVLASDDVEKFVPPKKGRKHVLRLIREVLTHDAEGHRTGLGDAVAYLDHVTRRHATVFVISDFLIPRAAEEQLATALRVARRRHDVVAVRLVDPLEERWPAVGLVEYRDLESGAVRLVDTSSRAVREHFERAARERRERQGEMLRRAGVDEIVIDVADEDWTAPLVAFFRRREKRGRRPVAGRGTRA